MVGKKEKVASMDGKRPNTKNLGIKVPAGIAKSKHKKGKVSVEAGKKLKEPQDGAGADFGSQKVTSGEGIPSGTSIRNGRPASEGKNTSRKRNFKARVDHKPFKNPESSTPESQAVVSRVQAKAPQPAAADNAKERVSRCHEEEPEATGRDRGVDKCTVFVRNVAFTTTDKKLEAAFSSIGPVRKCFLVTQPGKDGHRGFGFVSFALPGDAERAAAKMNGSDLEGRKLKVEIAKKRESFDTRRAKKEEGERGQEGGGGGEEKGEKGGRDKDKEDDLQDEHEGKGKKGHEKGGGLTMAATLGQGAEDERVEKSFGVEAKEEMKKLAEERKVEKKKERKQRHDAVVGDSGKGGAATQSAVQQAARTVIFGGLATEEMKRLVKDTIQKFGPKVAEDFSLPEDKLLERGLKSDGCSTPAASVEFFSIRAARAAVAALHGKTVASGASSTRQTAEEKGVDSGSHGRVWARQFGGEGSRPKKNRVIARNLPFEVNEKKLRSFFSSAGFVWELSLPKGDDGRLRGFAFVSFTSHSDAEKAISTINGKTFSGRTIAVDWAVEKKVFTAAAAEQKGEELEGADGEEDEELEEEGDETGNETASDDDEEEEKVEEIRDERGVMTTVLKKVLGGKVGGDGDEEDDGGDRGDVSDDDDFERHESELDECEVDEMDADHGDDEDDDDEDGQDANEEGDNDEGTSDEEEEGGGKRQEGEEQEGTGLKAKVSEGQGSVTKFSSAHQDGQPPTVFVRNLVPSVTPEEVKRAFSQFGRVKSCRLVLHPVTRRPQGTAFIEYSDRAGIEKSIQAARDGDKRLVIGGKAVLVYEAVGKDEARRLAGAVAESRDGPLREKQTSKDRRNLYLAQEGVIPEGSAAAKGMSKEDLEKRKRLSREKESKLRSPNFFVSQTRLSVHNLPKTMTEGDVKKIFIEAVKRRATKQQPVIKQVKILRDASSSRKGPDGQPRSKGAAFVEFSTHEHALVALRALNNNPDIFTPERRPIVEFSIENSLILRKREQMQQAAKKRVAERASSGNRESGGLKKRREDGGRGGKGEMKGSAGIDAQQGRQATVPESLRHERKRRGFSEENGFDGKEEVQERVKGKQEAKRRRSTGNKSSERDNQDDFKNSSSEGPIAREKRLGKHRETKLDEGKIVRQPKKKDGGDKFESLVESYRSKILGFSSAPPSRNGNVKSIGSMDNLNLKRWFE